MDTKLRLAGTGHRPPKLGLTYEDADRLLLENFVRTELARISGIEEVVSGFALGFDQALAQAAVDLGYYLTAAIPFEGQESRWPMAARERYQRLLKKARKIQVCNGFADRDRWMVKNSDVVLSLFDETQTDSGTALTVNYAKKLGRPVLNIWDKFLIIRA